MSLSVLFLSGLGFIYLIIVDILLSLVRFRCHWVIFSCLIFLGLLTWRGGCKGLQPNQAPRGTLGSCIFLVALRCICVFIFLGCTFGALVLGWSIAYPGGLAELLQPFQPFLFCVGQVLPGPLSCCSWLLCRPNLHLHFGCLAFGGLAGRQHCLHRARLTCIWCFLCRTHRSCGRCLWGPFVHSLFTVESHCFFSPLTPVIQLTNP
mmetsp:Transcript_84046/g.133228  ORF Transcript_84046/g.133228 Transcript_84046/m.133228 type:complete len:206 (+) Transcript_84046:1069-1686(+)